MDRLIEKLIEIRYITEGCDKSDDIDKLNNTIKDFLIVYCCHDFEIDYIDTVFEEGRCIKYCKKCWVTFQ